jgi:hypothetical protein
MFIALLTLLSALSISSVAIFYSVIGLATIFPGAFWPVVIMGSVLEVGKLITASWLYRNWRFTPFLLRSYLTIAIIVLSAITSMGIFGFLSKAHLEQNLASDTVTQRIEIINNKIASQQVIIDRQKATITRAESSIQQNSKDFSADIAIEQKKIDDAYKRLEVLDADVKAYTDQGKSILKGDNIRRGVELRASQKPERDRLNAQIESAKAKIDDLRQSTKGRGTDITGTIQQAESKILSAQNQIDQLIQERDPLQSSLIKLEAEVGPIKYIAALAVDWGITEQVNTSTAVRWVILIIILVFDPLAVLLLIAANQSLARIYPPKPPKPQKIIDLENPDDENITLQWNEMMTRANQQAAKEREQKLKDQIAEWQDKLKKFNEKAPKPSDRPVEIIVDQPREKSTQDVLMEGLAREKAMSDAEYKQWKKYNKTQEEKEAEWKIRMAQEEAELERVARETRADIERIEKNSNDYNPDHHAHDMQVKEEPTIAEQIEEVMLDERVKPDLTEVVEPETKFETSKKPRAGMLGGVFVDKGKVVNPPLTEAEKKELIKEYDTQNSGTDHDQKLERDAYNVYQFLKQSPITAEEARSHPPVTQSRMAYFEDTIDDIKRGTVRAGQLPPEVRKTVSVLLSEYDNPTIQEPRPKPLPELTVRTMTTEGLAETFAPEPTTEDRDITNDELDALLSGTEEELADGAYDIMIQGGRKIRVPKRTYKQNSEQEISGNWSRIKELDLPEPEKNEIILPTLPSETEPELEADTIQVANTLPKEKILNHKKRLINDDEYRQRIESRINDLITKIESGELQLNDLTPEDQTVIIGIMKEQGN